MIAPPVGLSAAQGPAASPHDMRQGGVTAGAPAPPSGRRAKTLRTRLALAFFLVGVPPMLGAAYVAAQLMSHAFERNVAQWLAKTSGFFRLEAHEAANEARRAAEVIARRHMVGGALDLKDFEADFALLGATGVDLLAVFQADGSLASASGAFALRAMLPVADAAGLFRMDVGGAPRVMTGAYRRLGPAPRRPPFWSAPGSTNPICATSRRSPI